MSFVLIINCWKATLINFNIFAFCNICLNAVKTHAMLWCLWKKCLTFRMAFPLFTGPLWVRIKKPNSQKCPFYDRRPGVFPIPWQVRLPSSIWCFYLFLPLQQQGLLLPYSSLECQRKKKANIVGNIHKKDILGEGYCSNKVHLINSQSIEADVSAAKATSPKWEQDINQGLLSLTCAATV